MYENTAKIAMKYSSVNDSVHITAGSRSTPPRFFRLALGAWISRGSSLASDTLPINEAATTAITGTCQP